MTVADKLAAGEFRHLPIGAIRERADNYNRESNHTFAKLLASIREFGFTDPIIVRAAGDGFEVIGGAHRLRAAGKLGMKTVPAVVLSGMSDADAKRLMITLNETRGSPDSDALSALIRDIKDSHGEEALEVLPYTDAELADLLDDEDGDLLGDDDDDIAPPVDDKPAKLKASDVAACFELEGARQADLQRVIEAIRKWRLTKSADAPAWRHLITALSRG